MIHQDKIIQPIQAVLSQYIEQGSEKERHWYTYTFG
jgi:hypothetical protein